MYLGIFSNALVLKLMDCRYNRLQLAVHTRDKNMFCDLLLANQNSKFWQSNFKVYPPTLELFGATPQTFEGKQSRSAMRSCILCWSFENQNEWNSCFWSGCLFNSPQKNTDSHFAIRRCELCDFIHDSCVFYLGRGFFKFFSFDVFLHLDFSCFFSSMNLSHVLSNLRLLVGEETSLVFSLYSMFTHFGTQYSDCLYPMWRPFFVQEISNLIRGFACNCCVDVVWCFTPI